jgi:hypothetical protein
LPNSRSRLAYSIGDNPHDQIAGEQYRITKASEQSGSNCCNQAILLKCPAQGQMSVMAMFHQPKKRRIPNFRNGAVCAATLRNLSPVFE